jgi:hypothetical protein
MKSLMKKVKHLMKRIIMKMKSNTLGARIRVLGMQNNKSSLVWKMTKRE